jgi:hypothetical protein
MFTGCAAGAQVSPSSSGCDRSAGDFVDLFDDHRVPGALRHPVGSFRH